MKKFLNPELVLSNIASEVITGSAAGPQIANNGNGTGGDGKTGNAPGRMGAPAPSASPVRAGL